MNTFGVDAEEEEDAVLTGSAAAARAAMPFLEPPLTAGLTAATAVLVPVEVELAAVDLPAVTAPFGFTVAVDDDAAAVPLLGKSETPRLVPARVAPAAAGSGGESD